jgi:hypothetical protein
MRETPPETPPGERPSSARVSRARVPEVPEKYTALSPSRSRSVPKKKKGGKRKTYRKKKGKMKKTRKFIY